MTTRNKIVGTRLFLTVLPLAMAACLPMVGGCVNQDSYDNLRASNDALKARNQELMDQVKALEDARRQLLEQYRRGDLTLDEAQRLIAGLEAELKDREARLADLNKRLEGLASGPLDAETDAALQDLAAKYPNILSYDAAKGMLRFTSDVTFASGSSDLTGEARTTIDALAKILRDLPSAQQYEIRVVGHTDTQAVTQRAGRAFNNNVELSAFRAMSVRKQLVSTGLPQNKVEFAGWGEFRPATPNTANGNTPGNRRVELYLLKSVWDKAMPSMPAPRAPAGPRAAAATTTVKPAAPAVAGAATTPALAPAPKPGETIKPGPAAPELVR